MNARVSALLFCWPAGLTAGTSANYSLSPAAVDFGGGHGSSVSYAAQVSQGPGGAGGSAAYTSRTGYAGQLQDGETLLLISLTPAVLSEAGAGQLQARLLSPEGAVTNLPAGGVTWTILSGPLTGITTGGLVTADKTYQTSSASVTAVSAGRRGTLSFSIAETIPDNFGVYAGDRLPDEWQVQYLGLSEPDGGQTGDPDHDGHNNLLEFAFGTDPGGAGSGSGDIAYSGGLLTSRGQPLQVVTNIPNGVDLRVVFGRRRGHESLGLRYQVQFSPDLLGWTTATTLPSVVAGDAEFEAVSVPWPFFLNGRKVRFFRMAVDFPPIP